MTQNVKIDYSINEAYKVLLKKGEFVDASRPDESGQGRVVPYKIYYPAVEGQDPGFRRDDIEGAGDDRDGKFPVVIWSHGFGGNRDGAAFLSRFLAGQGYILVHITHDGTDSSLWEGKKEHPWDVLRKVSVSRETTLARFHDVPFVLDQLPNFFQEHSEIGAVADMERLGMSGHSFGAMTSQVMAGQMFPDVDGRLISMKEDRFKAGILYSPVPIRHLVNEEPEAHIYGPIDIPMMHMTGTEDDSPLEGFGYERRLVVHEYSGSAEKYLQVLEGGDHMVYNGTRGKLGASDLREVHEEQIKIAALAFWDAYLKSEQSAKDWLSENYAKV